MLRNPHITFFLGAEFSSNSYLKNLPVLSMAFQKIIETKEAPEEFKHFDGITFHSAFSNNQEINEIASSFQEGDIILAASRGGEPATILINQLNEKKITPKVGAFETYGLKLSNLKTAYYFRQNGNNKMPISSEADDRFYVYEYADPTSILNRKTGVEKQLIGHAAYALRQEVIDNYKISYSRNIIQLKNEEYPDPFLLTPQLEITNDDESFTRQYHWVLGRQHGDKIAFDPKNPFVFQLGFIAKVAFAIACANGKELSDNNPLGEPFKVILKQRSKNADNLATSKQEKKIEKVQSYQNEQIISSLPKTITPPEVKKIPKVIRKDDLEKVMAQYKSKSRFTIFRDNSVAIRKLRDLITGNADQITEAEIRKAIKADSSRRLDLLDGKGQANDTATDAVIIGICNLLSRPR